MGAFLEYLNESKYVRRNANPYEKTDNGDCFVRSASLALGIPYCKVCEMLNHRCVDGKGLDADGISDREILEFSKKYKLIKPVKFDLPFYSYINGETEDYVPTEKWPTVSQFADMARRKYIVFARMDGITDYTKEGSRYLVEDTAHAIYVDGTEHKYYDIMKRKDPGEMIVYGYYRVLGVKAKV